MPSIEVSLIDLDSPDETISQSTVHPRATLVHLAATCYELTFESYTTAARANRLNQGAAANQGAYAQLVRLDPPDARAGVGLPRPVLRVYWDHQRPGEWDVGVDIPHTQLRVQIHFSGSGQGAAVSRSRSATRPKPSRCMPTHPSEGPTSYRARRSTSPPERSAGTPRTRASMDSSTTLTRRRTPHLVPADWTEGVKLVISNQFLRQDDPAYVPKDIYVRRLTTSVPIRLFAMLPTEEEQLTAWKAEGFCVQRGTGVRVQCPPGPLAPAGMYKWIGKTAAEARRGR